VCAGPLETYLKLHRIKRDHAVVNERSALGGEDSNGHEDFHRRGGTDTVLAAVANLAVLQFLARATNSFVALAAALQAGRQTRNIWVFGLAAIAVVLSPVLLISRPRRSRSGSWWLVWWLWRRGSWCWNEPHPPNQGPRFSIRSMA
jgi:hypothetical protein